MMDWTQTLTIIASMAGILTGYAFLLNKRIDDLREDLNRRMDRLEHRMDRLEQRMDKLEDELKEIRMLLYKVLEVPHKEEK
jgi:Prefoldin subunit.